mgnify:CR=1 FL=1
MQKLFLKGLGITLLLNLLVKPATIFLVDIKMQNELGSATYGIFQTMLSFTFLFSMFLDMGIDLKEHIEKIVIGIIVVSTLPVFLKMIKKKVVHQE